MKKLIGLMLLAAGLTAVSPVRAAGPEARVAWGLEFGGASPRPQPTYQLGLGLARVPLFGPTYRASAQEEGAEPTSGGSWVPWVVGGLVAIVAIGAETAEDHHDKACVGCGETASNGVTGVGVDDDGASVGCVNGDCAVCPNGDVASDCEGLVARPLRGEMEIDVVRQRWLDAGTGHMGDLRPFDAI